MRIPKSFTIDADISAYVEETKNGRSASDRLNQLLRRAILQERYDRLEAEAEQFFSKDRADRAETKAFQKASLRALARD